MTHLWKKVRSYVVCHVFSLVYLYFICYAIITKFVKSQSIGITKKAFFFVFHIVAPNNRKKEKRVYRGTRHFSFTFTNWEKITLVNFECTIRELIKSKKIFFFQKHSKTTLDKKLKRTINYI